MELQLCQKIFTLQLIYFPCLHFFLSCKVHSEQKKIALNRLSIMPLNGLNIEQQQQKKFGIKLGCNINIIGVCLSDTFPLNKKGNVA